MEIIENLIKPSITDWIQAIGSVAAFIGVAFSIWKLIVKDEQKQEQLNKLTDLVTKIDIQNEILKSEFKLSILPFFKISGNTLEGRHGQVTSITNHGNFALNISILPSNESQSDFENNSIFTFELMNKDSFIDRSSSINVNIKRISNFDTSFKLLPYSFKILYQDRMYNRYYQVVRYKDSIFDITEPKIVEINSENIINNNENNYDSQ